MVAKLKGKRLRKFIRQWTRCEIMARYAPIAKFEFANYYFEKIKLEEEIRREMFGNDNLYELGIKFGILKEPPKGKRKRKTIEKGKE